MNVTSVLRLPSDLSYGFTINTGVPKEDASKHSQEWSSSGCKAAVYTDPFCGTWRFQSRCPYLCQALLHALRAPSQAARSEASLALPDALQSPPSCAELGCTVARLSDEQHARCSRLLGQLEDQMLACSQPLAVQSLQQSSNAEQQIATGITAQHHQDMQATAEQLREVMQHLNSLQQLAALTQVPLSTAAGSKQPDADAATSHTSRNVQIPHGAQDTQHIRDQKAQRMMSAAPVQHQQEQREQQGQQQAAGPAPGSWLAAAVGPAAEHQLASWLSQARVQLTGARREVLAHGADTVEHEACWGPLDGAEACAVALASELVLAGGAQLLAQLQQEGPLGPLGAVHAALHDKVQRLVPGLAVGTLVGAEVLGRLDGQSACSTIVTRSMPAAGNRRHQEDALLHFISPWQRHLQQHLQQLLPCCQPHVQHTISSVLARHNGLATGYTTAVHSDGVGQDGAALDQQDCSTCHSSSTDTSSSASGSEGSSNTSRQCTAASSGAATASDAPDAADASASRAAAAAAALAPEVSKLLLPWSFTGEDAAEAPTQPMITALLQEALMLADSCAASPAPCSTSDRSSRCAAKGTDAAGAPDAAQQSSTASAPPLPVSCSAAVTSLLQRTIRCREEVERQEQARWAAQAAAREAEGPASLATLYQRMFSLAPADAACSRAKAAAPGQHCLAGLQQLQSDLEQLQDTLQQAREAGSCAATGAGSSTITSSATDLQPSDLVRLTGQMADMVLASRAGVRTKAAKLMAIFSEHVVQAMDVTHAMAFKTISDCHTSLRNCTVVLPLLPATQSLAPLLSSAVAAAELLLWGLEQQLQHPSAAASAAVADLSTLQHCAAAGLDACMYTALAMMGSTLSCISTLAGAIENLAMVHGLLGSFMAATEQLLAKSRRLRSQELTGQMQQALSTMQAYASLVQHMMARLACPRPTDALALPYEQVLAQLRVLEVASRCSPAGLATCPLEALRGMPSENQMMMVTIAYVVMRGCDSRGRVPEAAGLLGCSAQLPSPVLIDTPAMSAMCQCAQGARTDNT